MLNKEQKLNKPRQPHLHKAGVGSSAVYSDKAHELADKWIKELSEAGFTYDDMISVFKESRRKFEDYKKRKQKR